MYYLWVASIIATLVIADNKRLSMAGYFFLALFLGPLAVIIALLAPSKAHEFLNKGSDFTLKDAKQELAALRGNLEHLRRQADALGSRIEQLSAQEPDVKIADKPSIEDEFKQMQKDVAEPAVVTKVAEEARPEEKELKAEQTAAPSAGMDVEINFGRNWLNKIGIVIFTLGVGFLISYTFKHFGPFFKIAFGYLVSAVLFFFGFKLEAKEKFVNFGRSLLGGAWALVYFTTYAMHHFEASRLIQSQFLDLCLLSLVIVGMMIHVLRYRSEGVMSLALFVAYFTTTLGEITGFTVVSCLFLGVLILFLVYKFQWIKTFIMGIVLTYGIHYVWVMPNLAGSARQAVVFGMVTPDFYLMMNFIFLTAYWGIFLAGIHIARAIKESRLINILAATNFGNIALYSALSYPLVLKLFYSHRFEIVLGLGVVYLALAWWTKRTQRRDLYVSDLVAAVFAITFSLPLKFMPTSTLLLWLIEIPFLLFIGFAFKDKIYRYFSYALSVFVGLRIFLLSLSGMPDVNFLGLIWSWQEFMCLWATISMGACFYLTKRKKMMMELEGPDKIFDQLFALASCTYLSFLLYLMIEQPWICLALSLEMLFLLFVGFLLKEEIFRYFSYGLSALFAAGFINTNLEEVQTVRFLNMSWAWNEFWSLWGIISMAGCFYLTRQVKRLTKSNDMDDIFDHVFPAASCFYLTFLIHSSINQPWVSFALSVEGVVLLAVSVGLVLARFRIYAYFIFLSAAAVFMMDSINVPSSFLKWFIIGVDVLVYFGVYYAVKSLHRANRISWIFDGEETLAFWAGIGLLVFTVFQYINAQWISLSLGIAGVVIILLGLSRKDKVERLGGLLLLALTFGRVILVDLAELDIIYKIITFTILGLLFVGISFIYNRSNFEHKKIS